MARGFVYLVAVVDWFTRKVSAWRVSITLEAEFCIEALKEALAQHGKPEIMNTDQDSQFTCIEFIKVLKDANIAISKDGKGAWRANARSGISQPAEANPGSGINNVEIHLYQRPLRMTAPFTVVARLDRAIQRGKHWFLWLWITRSSRVMTRTNGSLSGAVGITNRVKTVQTNRATSVERPRCL